LVLGLVLIRAIPRISPPRSVLVLALLLATLGLLGSGAYVWKGILIDASVPGIALGLVFATMLAQTLSEANAQRKVLRERLQLEREEAARLTGELDAARRIQVGILPRADVAFPGERRFEIYASMEPAREVGGDLYDFFMLDPDRLFFLVGDVSGKGLPASIFMAVSKALCKSAALRRAQQVGTLLREAGAEIARENPESLFVTVFAGVLDARTGRMEYCCAGHEPPFIFAPGSKVTRFEAGNGPPLCVLEGFSYNTAEIQMKPGGTLCLVSDGVTEAMNPAGELYGARRLSQALERARDAQSPAALVSAIRADLARFVAGAEAADDITLLVLRWNAR
jgi:serine phosphatase RsbU (regulator of sigma subunit)